MTNLFERKLIIVGGKGGVGRTTVATALAVAAARRGKRTLLCQTKSKERLSQLLAVPSVGSELVEVRPRLSAVNMTPQAALREYGTMVLRSEFVAKQVLENRLSRAFLHAVPGLEDYSMLGKVWYHTTEEERGRPRWDLVVLDGPATGHLITMLSVPDAILRAVPEGPLTKPAAATQGLLRDPVRTAILLVTLAEDLPTNETIELAARLRGLQLPLSALVINQLFPPRFVQGASARALAQFDRSDGAVAADPVLAPLLDRARTVAHRRALNERYMARLAVELPLPQVQLPLLFSDNFGAAAVEDLSNRLEGQLLAISA